MSEEHKPTVSEMVNFPLTLKDIGEQKLKLTFTRPSITKVFADLETQMYSAEASKMKRMASELELEGKDRLEFFASAHCSLPSGIALQQLVWAELTRPAGILTLFRHALEEHHAELAQDEDALLSLIVGEAEFCAHTVALLIGVPPDTEEDDDENDDDGDTSKKG